MRAGRYGAVREVTVPEETLVDFAVVAFREDECWQVADLPPHAADDLDSFVAALRQVPSDGLSLGLSSFGDDFFLAVRPDGGDLRLLLSDAGAATDYPIARQVLERLSEVVPVDADDELVRPVGDLGLFADLGVSAMEVAAVCGDLEQYPDEMLAQIAARIGFGQQFDQAVDADLV
jgi:putative tRNA adenosine deaminase-associated protein